MIFSELYGAYYNAVSKVLTLAAQRPVTKQELRKIIEAEAFSESLLSIEPGLFEERWQLLARDGTTPLKHSPTMPLTTLQKRWLKAISLDPRIRLFDFDTSYLGEVEPLFYPGDVYIFDCCNDGDPFEDEQYIRNFRLILRAIKEQRPLSIEINTQNGNCVRANVMPQCLEYSEKDDKFRLVTFGCRHTRFINLGRILSCRFFEGQLRSYNSELTAPTADQSLVIELYDGRAALERVLLHFAHFEKQAERLDEKRYRIKINYCKADETEMVIRVLSFGPFIKVTEPESFVGLIRKRLKMQKSCEPG